MSGAMPLSRRHLLLHFGGAAGLALLAGCRQGTAPPKLLAAPETVPGRWQKALPSPWQFLPLEPEDSITPLEKAEQDSVDLIALTDGWLSSLPQDRLQPVQAAALQSQLDQTAARFLQLQGAARAAQLLPVGVSPWVMLFRRADSWNAASVDSWDVLLDRALTGHVVLPLSPRLVIELADRIEAPDALQRLRRQVLTYDDRQGINWLLKDQARVLVTPLQRCMRLLRRDPRLSAVLPTQGAPLHWTLLMRPADTREPFPQAWVETAWSLPMLGRLVGSGWRPPLKSLDVPQLRSGLPTRWRDLLLPPMEVWSRCWSLPPLTQQQRTSLSRRWQASAP